MTANRGKAGQGDEIHGVVAPQQLLEHPERFSPLRVAFNSPPCGTSTPLFNSHCIAGPKTPTKQL